MLSRAACRSGARDTSTRRVSRHDEVPHDARDPRRRVQIQHGRLRTPAFEHLASALRIFPRWDDLVDDPHAVREVVRRNAGHVDDALPTIRMCDRQHGGEQALARRGRSVEHDGLRSAQHRLEHRRVDEVIGDRRAREGVDESIPVPPPREVEAILADGQPPRERRPLELHANEVRGI